MREAEVEWIILYLKSALKHKAWRNILISILDDFLWESESQL